MVFLSLSRVYRSVSGPLLWSLAGLLGGIALIGTPVSYAQVPAAHEGIAEGVLAQCSACHAEPRRRPRATTLKNDCARCHGADVAGLTRVSHLESRARDTVSSVRPDPVLARNPQTIVQQMVRVEGGPFVLGDDTRHKDEGPMQERTLPTFYIDKHEVTNSDFHRFTMATGREAPAHWGGHRPPNALRDHPVVEVSWYDARDFCVWRGKRLPTEFEWEKAARGTDGLKFPWGDIFDASLGNSPQSGIGHTSPVGQFPLGASPYGALDMAGNVWEWTDSWYKPYPGNTRSNPNYGETYRIVRGGSWFDCEFYRCGISAPTYNRGFFIPNTRNDTFGFRCAYSAADPLPNRKRTRP